MADIGKPEKIIEIIPVKEPVKQPVKTGALVGFVTPVPKRHSTGDTTIAPGS